MVTIMPADEGKILAQVKELFSEYAAALGCNPCFKNLEQEIAALPGDYSPPGGSLLVARYDNRVAGCVALKRLDENACEMKRLYVRPEFRGKGIGKALVLSAVEDARKLGYRHIRLNTLPSMKEAIPLYHFLGFYDIQPYGATPIPGALYMEFTIS
ncbi:MAG: GNAT family N-acetyltransferase [Alphaproteobacteria bacterium]|uniref:GNAT family N-acetyltransferase n=1 Tax=Candidatus Nitrobium versatile TaxID=2884831 RepID=A0A953J5J9_9BACT|nr:GNAT family N-acetyltransferase [Candidatus Nitrobium versatile]